jgi:two-component system response regulator PilR (NtrC family)
MSSYSHPGAGMKNRNVDSGAGLFYADGSPLEELLRQARTFAEMNSPVVLQGESGTGKDVVARFLHRHSPRAGGPFVAVNCAAIAPGLLESELFGHRRGAFTSAVSNRPGNIRQANGGTLFLDEIGDLPLEAQSRFLRVLQDKKVRPVGGDEDVPVDFRLVCATHRDLEAEVRAKRFREDLYYRLRVLELYLPPLRERARDIPCLLRAFLGEMLGEAAAAAAVEGMPAEWLAHPFPGNVRELRNLAERYVAHARSGGGWAQIGAPRKSPAGATVAGAEPPSPGAARPPEVPLRVAEPPPAYRAVRTSRHSESEVLAALESCGFHRGHAAEKLGISRRALQYHLSRMRARAASAGTGGA